MKKFRTWVNRPYVKYPLIVLGAGLWLLGLQDQFGSPEPVISIGKYVGFSALMGAIAALA